MHKSGCPFLPSLNIHEFWMHVTYEFGESAWLDWVWNFRVLLGVGKSRIYLEPDASPSD